jgi:hypothetical protein
MTAKDMAALIGCDADYRVGDLLFAVMIDDARNRFGSVDVLIRPSAGSGVRWVSRDSVCNVHRSAVNA